MDNDEFEELEELRGNETWKKLLVDSLLEEGEVGEEDEDYECPGCGKTFSEFHSYCPHCGIELEE